MINLLKETKKYLADHGKTLDDVKMVIVRDWIMPIELFTIQADKEYDNGFGSNKVDLSLMLVGDNWWIERSEYDGAEEWEYKTIPIRNGNETERYDISIWEEDWEEDWDD